MVAFSKQIKNPANMRNKMSLLGNSLDSDRDLTKVIENAQNSYRHCISTNKMNSENVRNKITLLANSLDNGLDLSKLIGHVKTCSKMCITL